MTWEFSRKSSYPTETIRVPSTLRKMLPTSREPSTSRGDTLAPRKSRREGFCSNKDSHGREWIGHAYEGDVIEKLNMC